MKGTFYGIGVGPGDPELLTMKAVKAMISLNGPCYLRLNRNDYPNTTGEDDPFRIGVPTVLREGNEVAVFAIGYMLNKALQAAEELKAEAEPAAQSMQEATRRRRAGRQ